MQSGWHQLEAKSLQLKDLFKLPQTRSLHGHRLMRLHPHYSVPLFVRCCSFSLAPLGESVFPFLDLALRLLCGLFTPSRPVLIIEFNRDMLSRIVVRGSQLVSRAELPRASSSLRNSPGRSPRQEKRTFFWVRLLEPKFIFENVYIYFLVLLELLRLSRQSVCLLLPSSLVIVLSSISIISLHSLRPSLEFNSLHRFLC